MKYKFILTIVLISLLLGSMEIQAISPTHEFSVGDSFDMQLVDLKTLGPESTGADLPGTDHWVTTDDIGLIVTNEVTEIKLDTLYPDRSQDKIRIRQSSPGIDFKFHLFTDLAYTPSFYFNWAKTTTPMLRPTYIIYNDWAFVKEQVDADHSKRESELGFDLLDIEWKEQDNLFTISYRVNRLQQFAFDVSQTKHIETVEVAYFKDTGIIAYFYLFLDMIDNEQPHQKEILYSNTDCDIQSCNELKGNIKSEEPNSKSDGSPSIPGFGIQFTLTFLFSVVFARKHKKIRVLN